MVRYITVETLKKRLNDLPNDAILVVDGGDHNYRFADIHVTTGVDLEPGERGINQLYEDHQSADQLMDFPDLKRYTVLLVTWTY